MFARNDGTAFGVDEDAINRCVVPCGAWIVWTDPPSPLTITPRPSSAITMALVGCSSSSPPSSSKSRQASSSVSDSLVRPISSLSANTRQSPSLPGLLLELNARLFVLLSATEEALDLSPLCNCDHPVGASTGVRDEEEEEC